MRKKDILKRMAKEAYEIYSDAYLVTILTDDVSDIISSNEMVPYVAMSMKRGEKNDIPKLS